MKLSLIYQTAFKTKITSFLLLSYSGETLFAAAWLTNLLSIYFFNCSISNLDKTVLTGVAARPCRSDLVYYILLFSENICSPFEENCLLECLDLFAVMLSLKLWICSVFLAIAFDHPV